MDLKNLMKLIYDMLNQQGWRNPTDNDPPLEIFMKLAVIPENGGLICPPGEDPRVILPLFSLSDPPSQGKSRSSP